MMIMSLLGFHSLLRRVASTLPFPLLYAATWMVLLIVAAVLASMAPAVAFMFAASPFSSFSEPCQHYHGGGGGEFVRIPLDSPREMVCLPENAVMSRSHLDFFLPTLFAALVVAASTCLLRFVVSA